MKIDSLSQGMKIVNDIGKTQEPTSAGAFGKVLVDALKSTANAQRVAESTTLAIASGEDIPANQVIEAINRADITLQTMVSVRDKAIEAYQEILRMPI